MTKTKNLLLKIISDSWDQFKSYRPQYATEYYDEVIDKVQKCGDPAEGFIRYQCTYCGEDEKIIGFTCKNSFCLKCGTIKSMKFVEEVKAKMISKVTYRHLTLTMPNRLWKIFYKHRHSNVLWGQFYQAGWSFINEIFQTVIKKKKIKAGAIMVIHTTGRKSSYNVHLHIILPMGALDMVSGRWIEVKTLPFNLLHFRWKKVLLNMLLSFDSSLEMKSLVKLIRKKYPKGFVANLDMRTVPHQNNKLAKYLAKYLFRPSISVKRILKYGKKENFIEYEYSDHETGKTERESVSIFTFIGRMVQQIMPKGFQRVRYYGIHGTSSAISAKRAVLEGMKKKESVGGQDNIAVIRARRLDYQQRILEWKDKDPLKCKKCSRTMELVEVWIKGKGIVFNLYEKLSTGPPYVDFSKKIEEKSSKLSGPTMAQQVLSF